MRGYWEIWYPPAKNLKQFIKRTDPTPKEKMESPLPSIGTSDFSVFATNNNKAIESDLKSEFSAMLSN